MNEERKVELLWKYVDNLCNEKEKIEVESLIANNTETQILYEEITMIDVGLRKKVQDNFSDSFKISLENKLKEEIGKIDFSPVTIFPKYMKASLIVLSIVVVVLTFLIPESKYNQKVPYTIPEINDVTFYNIIAITSGVIFLWVVDKVLNKNKKPNNNVHFLCL